MINIFKKLLINLFIFVSLSIFSIVLLQLVGLVVTSENSKVLFSSIYGLLLDKYLIILGLAIALIIVIKTNNHKNNNKLFYLGWIIVLLFLFWKFLNSISILLIFTAVVFVTFVLYHLQVSKKEHENSSSIPDVTDVREKYGIYYKDDPIKSKKEDLYYRNTFVNDISSYLRNLNNETNNVISIEGVWGSGKSSIVSLIKEDLKNDNIQIIEFNPWIFSNTNDLILSFFNLLVTELKINKFDSLTNDLSRYALEVTNNAINNIPSAGNPTILISKLLGKGILSQITNYFSKNKSLEETKESINRKLSSRDKKVLIIIDDIDRLNKKETKQIMKLVKAVADFSNVTYLLSYDRNKVEKDLNDYKNIGETYLNKIVQKSYLMPISYPEILNKDVREIMQKYYEYVNEFYGIDTTGVMVPPVVNTIAKMDHLFSTPREFKRFISGLVRNLDLFWQSIEPSHILIIELIKVAFPKQFELMRKTESRDFLKYETKSQEFTKFCEEKQFMVNSFKNQEIFCELLDDLNLIINDDKHIFYEKNFENYLAVSMDGRDLSIMRFKEILMLMCNDEDWTKWKKNSSLREKLLFFAYLTKTNKVNEYIYPLPLRIRGKSLEEKRTFIIEKQKDFEYFCALDPNLTREIFWNHSSDSSLNESSLVGFYHRMIYDSSKFKRNVLYNILFNDFTINDLFIIDTFIDQKITPLPADTDDNGKIIGKTKLFQAVDKKVDLMQLDNSIYYLYEHDLLVKYFSMLSVKNENKFKDIKQQIIDYPKLFIMASLAVLSIWRPSNKWEEMDYEEFSIGINDFYIKQQLFIYFSKEEILEGTSVFMQNNKSLSNFNNYIQNLRSAVNK